MRGRRDFLPGRPVIVHMKTAPATITIGDYSQLAQLAWSRKLSDVITGEEAFALYEGNWRMVDQNQLGQTEQRLIEALKEVFGHGLINV